MSFEYMAQCLPSDEELDVNSGPLMFLPPFTLQTVQPGEPLPLSELDCNQKGALPKVHNRQATVWS